MSESESELKPKKSQNLEVFLKSEGIKIAEDETTLQSILENYIEDKSYGDFEGLDPSMKSQMMHELFIDEAEDHEEEGFRDIRLDKLSELKENGSQVLLLREFVVFLDDTIGSLRNRKGELEDKIEQDHPNPDKYKNISQDELKRYSVKPYEPERNTSLVIADSFLGKFREYKELVSKIQEIQEKIGQLKKIREESKATLDRLADLEDGGLAEVKEIESEFDSSSSTNEAEFSRVKTFIENYLKKAEEKHKGVCTVQESLKIEQSEEAGSKSRLELLKKQISKIRDLVNFFQNKNDPDQRIQEWKQLASEEIKSVKNQFNEKIREIKDKNNVEYNKKALLKYLEVKKEEIVGKLEQKKDYDFDYSKIDNCKEFEVEERETISLEDLLERRKSEVYRLLKERYKEEKKKFESIYNKIERSKDDLEKARKKLEKPLSGKIVNWIRKKITSYELPEISIIKLQTRNGSELEVTEEQQTVFSDEEVEELKSNQEQQQVALVKHFSAVLNDIKAKSRAYLPEKEEDLFSQKKSFYRILIEDLNCSKEEILQIGDYRKKYQKGKNLQKKKPRDDLSEREKYLVKLSIKIDKAGQDEEG